MRCLSSSPLHAVITSFELQKMIDLLVILSAIATVSVVYCAPSEVLGSSLLPNAQHTAAVSVADSTGKPVTFHAAAPGEQIGIDAPYIFIHPSNQTRPGNMSFGNDLMQTILQALMPVNSTATPSLENRAKSSQELAPDMLLNNLLAAMIPVLAAASKNEIETASHQVEKSLIDFSQQAKAKHV